MCSSNRQAHSPILLNLLYSGVNSLRGLHVCGAGRFSNSCVFFFFSVFLISHHNKQRFEETEMDTVVLV